MSREILVGVAGFERSPAAAIRLILCDFSISSLTSLYSAFVLISSEHKKYRRRTCGVRPNDIPINLARDRRFSHRGMGQGENN